jgi:poly(3-hydroxybutyrate) depolymerase
MTMIDRAVTERNADNHRVFVAGFSNGGGGTWNMLSRYDGRFAAAIAVSSVVPAGDFVASRLVDTSILAVHARNDDVTPVHNSRAVINAILSAANEPLPVYLSTTNPSQFFLSNSSFGTHQTLRDVAHQQGATTDFLISNPALDLMYYDSTDGGHSGALGVFTSPDVYTWLYGHTTAPAVPEPTMVTAFVALLFTAGLRYRRVRAC